MDSIRIISPADPQAEILPGGTFTRATGFFAFFSRGFTLVAALCACAGQALQTDVASLDELGIHLVEALNASDSKGIEALMLTEQEYSQILYPALPLSKPDWNTPSDVAWSMHRASRDKIQQRIMTEWGGRNLQYLSLTYSPEIEKHADFEILRHATLQVRLPDATTQTMSFMGSALRKDGRIKLIGWKDN